MPICEVPWGDATLTVICTAWTDSDEGGSWTEVEIKEVWYGDTEVSELFTSDADSKRLDKLVADAISRQPADDWREAA